MSTITLNTTAPDLGFTSLMDVLHSHGRFIQAEDEAFANRRPDIWTDMRLYVDSDARFTHEDRCAEAAVTATLRSSVVSLHHAPRDDRSEVLTDFLYDAVQRTGESGRLMFRVAAAVATYVGMMPSRRVAVNRPVVCAKTGRTYFGWSSTHGNFVDVVVLLPQPPADRERTVEAALSFGQTRFPDTFEGVRYLPLEEPSLSCWHRPDRTHALLAQPADLPRC